MSGMLRQKGPLLAPRSSPASSAQYQVKSSSGDEVAFELLKKSRKHQEQGEEEASPALYFHRLIYIPAKQFDSAHIISPFLDPKVLERRVMALKKGQI